ncbi:hypothetical protein M8J76_005621 [Diaphorina citri]|nr:hypothetical protein M8J76_005621 [Diaphorina citri]
MRRQPKCSSRPASTSWDPSPLARSDPAMSPAATLAPLPPAPLPSSAPVYGSSLSQSMNYANTWLYGTVSLKPQCRPGLMICAAEASGPGPGPPSFAIVMCNCPEFLIGTTRSKKSLCKKCGGARTTNWNMDEFANQSAPGIHNNLSRRYNTVRINRPITGFNMELDPYMLMRKSRFKTEKNDQLVSKNSNANRKSILECHVNPYDLIKFNKYYDTGQQAEDKKLRDNTGCKINKILDNTESVNTSSGSKKINKLLNKFKFKSSSNTPVPTSNISIAGHRININNKGDRAPVKISEEFVKDSSESEDFDEPEVDYSDHEFEHNTEREHPNQKSKQSSEQTNKDMKNTHNDSISLRQHQTNETTSDYSTRNKEYKSQSFNHYTDHNIFSQRKHSIPEIPRYQNKSNSNAVSRNHESNDSKHFEQSRNLTSNKVNDQVAINKEVNISNETNNNIENRLRNFKINESIISRHYDGNKRHSFDPYRMSELQKMMMHSEPNKRHSVCEAPNLAFLENSANDHESRSVNSQADNHNVGHLNRSNSQISTNSSHKSIHQDSDDGEDKIDLLETKIKPIPRISVRPVSNKFNTSTPVRPPRKSKSIDCTYRNPYQQITENENRKPRAYSMDRTNSINEMDLLRQNSQQGEDIVAIRTNKTDPVKKFKEKNQSKLNMSTFKYETTSDVSSKTAENQNVKRRVQQEDDDLDCNYILQSATKSKDKSKNQTFNTSQDTNSQQRRSSNTNPATFYRESKAAANYRTGSLTSDQMREIRAHFNARNAFTEKISNDSNTKSNQVTLPRAKHEPSPTKHKDTSPAPIDAKDNAKVSPNNTTDQDESSSDFMYDFFIHRNNKFNSISSTNSTEIKSILKKKLDEDIYNASVISSNDSTSGSSSVVTSSGIVTGDSSKVGGTRKKKQVQFEAAATAEDEPLVATIQKSSKISFEDITAGEETCAEEDIVEDNATGDLDTCADGEY